MPTRTNHARFPRSLTALLAAGLALPCTAQNDDPYELMRELDSMLIAAEGFTYTATRQGQAAFATTPTRTGTVTASLRDGELRLRIDGKAINPDGSTPAFLSTYDGETVTSVRHGDKQVVTGPLDATFGALGTSGAGLTSWLLLWNNHLGGAFRDGHEAYPLEYDGLAMVNGKPCHTIRIGFDDYGGVNEYESWMFLNTDTGMPARFEFGYYDDAADLGIVTLTFDSFKLLDTVESTTFAAPETPSGYELVEYEAQEFDFGFDGGMDEPEGIAVGEPAPEWSLEDPEGNDFALSDYRGKVVVMDFWATWCGPCIMAMPGLQKLHEEFKGDAVAVIGVNCWESGNPEAFMASKGFDYQLLLGGDNVATEYGVSGIPTFYVVGKDGRVVHHEVGFDPDGTDRLREVIKKALAD